SNNTNVLYSVATDGSIATLTANKFLVHQTTAGVQAKPDVIYRNGYVHVIYQDLVSSDVMYRRGIIVNAVGVQELENKLSIYPNPTSDELTIEYGMGTDGAGVITDLSGREVLRFECTGEKTIISLRELPVGEYLL